MNYPAPSPRYIAARWHGGDQTPRLIVMHSTVSPCEAGQALAVARYFARTETPASAHYTVDTETAVQCVKDHTVAYHCGWNQDSIGVEMCEVPTWNLARWATPKHRAMRRQAVHLVAQLCLAYDIPPRFVGTAALLDGKHGITTHRVMSRTYHHSTHWDPGAWPRRSFMRAVRRRIRTLTTEGK